jgi:hypothetical protein
MDDLRKLNDSLSAMLVDAETGLIEAQVCIAQFMTTLLDSLEHARIEVEIDIPWRSGAGLITRHLSIISYDREEEFIHCDFRDGSQSCDWTELDTGTQFYIANEVFIGFASCVKYQELTKNGSVQ